MEALEEPLPEPLRVNRDERSFHTYQEAEKAMGCTLPPNVRELFKQPRFEQRTTPWYDARYGALTASDLAAAIGMNPYQSPKQVFKKKTGLVEPFTGNAFTQHGVFYEDVCAFDYEARTGKKILDFGLLSHWEMFKSKPDSVTPEAWHGLCHCDPPDELPENCPITREEWESFKDLAWLKGSPDGVTTDGILIEIKCPRKIMPGHIREYYYPQVQLLMELSNTEMCHYIQYVPQTSRLWKAQMDILEVKRDREWMRKYKEVARFTWDAITMYRQSNIMPSVINQYLAEQKRKRKNPVLGITFVTEEEEEIKRRKKLPLEEAVEVIEDSDDELFDDGTVRVKVPYNDLVSLMESMNLAPPTPEEFIEQKRMRLWGRAHQASEEGQNTWS
jgi:hypothetical protein